MVSSRPSTRGNCVSARTARACIVGAYEHPTRKAPDKSVAQLHAESARRGAAPMPG